MLQRADISLSRYHVENLGAYSSRSPLRHTSPRAWTHQFLVTFTLNPSLLTHQNWWECLGDWDWDEVEMAVLCHAPFCYIIHLHAARRGAPRSWNINTNEVGSLTTQTQHLYRAGLSLYSSKRMPHASSSTLRRLGRCWATHSELCALRRGRW